MQTLINIIRPEFFDIFGIFVFLFLFIISIWSIKKTFPKWAIVVLLIISVLGLIVDGTIVYITYLR